MKSTLSYDSRWLRLDNAGKIYPVVATEKNSGVFRVAAIMDSSVDPILLTHAVMDCKERFPSFYVKLREGLFWFYYEPNELPPLIQKERPYICDKMNTHQNNGYLFNFFYYENRIALEVFHSLSDGTGAFVLLKAVIARYLELSGINILNDGSLLQLEDRPTKEELEDSYNALYTKKKASKFSNIRAYRMKGTKFRAPGGIGLIHATVNTTDLRALAKKYDVTISQYLVALLNYAIVKTGDFKKLAKHPIRSSVPVNMRRFLYSQSLRNFSLFFNTTLYATHQDMSFDEVLKSIKAQFEKELTQERLQDRLNVNVAFEKNFFIKILPLAVKKLLFKIGYVIIGHRPSTISLTNFGPIELPKTMVPYVKGFEFNLASGHKPGVAVNTYHGKTKIIFNRPYRETDLERFFIRQLSDEGLHVTIDTNHWQ